jgi:hypothetical protein
MTDGLRLRHGGARSEQRYAKETFVAHGVHPHD